VLPVGIAGTEALFPIGDHEIHPVRIVARIGRPMRAAALERRAAGNRRLMMDVVGLTIAALLPEDYRGAYGDEVAGLEEARVIARDLISTQGPPSGGPDDVRLTPDTTIRSSK
jgi:hypothetical protein